MNLLSFCSNIKRHIGLDTNPYTEVKNPQGNPIPNQSLKTTNNKNQYSYAPSLLNNIRSNTIADLFLRVPFVKRDKLSPRVIKKANLFTEYLQDIKKDDDRFKNPVRVKHGQHQMWQGMITTSLSQAEKRQHSRIRNFFLFKSKGNSHQRLATSHSVSAWSHDPRNHDYEPTTFWQKLGHKITSLLTFDTTKNLDLLSDGYRMRSGYLHAGKNAQKDILPSHLSTIHAGAIMKLLGGSDVFVAGLAGMASIAGLIMDGRAQMNVNIAQETLIDGMVTRLANSSTNPKQLEAEFKLLEGKIQLASTNLLRVYGEFNCENLKENKNPQKLEYLKQKLKNVYVKQLFSLFDFPVDTNAEGKFNKNKYCKFVQNNKDQLFLLQFIKESELDECYAKLMNQSGRADIDDVISMAAMNKISQYSKNLKQQTESYQEHHRRHVDNFKEVFTVHFYQNQARILGAAGIGVSFGFGVPVGAIISLLGKGALQLLTSSLDEAIRYNFRMSTFVKDGSNDFFYAEALNSSLGEVMRNSNPIEFEEQMSKVIFSESTIEKYKKDLTKLENELFVQKFSPNSDKNLILALEIKIAELKDIINTRIENKQKYYYYKSNFERSLNFGSTQNKDDILWDKQDYETHLLLEDKIASRLPDAERKKLELKNIQLIEKAKINHQAMFNKLITAKGELNALLSKYSNSSSSNSVNNKQANLYEEKKSLVDNLLINQKFLNVSVNALDLCNKHLNIFKNILFNKQTNSDLEYSCKDIYGEKYWNKLLPQEKIAKIQEIRAVINTLSDLGNGKLILNPSVVLGKHVSELKYDLENQIKINNNKLKIEKKYVDNIDKEIQNAKVKYSQIYLSITTPNLRKSEDALAECCIKKDTIKSQLKARTTVREEQCDRVFNHKLSGLFRKVTNSNLMISNYLTYLGVQVQTLDATAFRRIIAKDKYLASLKSDLEANSKKFMELQNDISLIKKTIMFTKRKEHNGKYIAKDASGKYVVVPDSWENAHEHISKNNAWVKQIFTDNTYLNWHVGNVDTVKPGEFSGQLGYRFFHLPGRLAIPLVGLVTELSEIAQTHNADPVFSSPANPVTLFNTQMADIQNQMIQGKTFSQAFGGVSILSFILIGIWNLKYNKQYLATDPIIQKRVAQFEKMIAKAYEEISIKKNILNYQPIDFDKAKKNDKKELDKITLVTEYLQSGSSQDTGKPLLNMLFYGFSILKESQIQPKKDINDKSYIPYLKLPNKFEVMEKQANGEEVTFFNLNPAITNHFAASNLGVTGKFARTRTTIKTLPIRARQIVPNVLIGSVAEPIRIINTHRNYMKTKSAYKTDIPMIQNIIKHTSQLITPSYALA
ncbi:MAG: hypothetical protein RLZZ210_314 [Pseudomonadota bacterium]|jgi:anion-transporting  ArsA/GET3 family ATPase